MAGLIVEGGAMRGVYTDGALDALLKYQIEFPYIIGVSAGICNAYSYASKQFGRNWEIVEKYRNDKRYYGKRNFIKCRSIFGMDFVYDEIPNKLIPYDMKALKEYSGQLIAGLTNAETGKVEYFNQSHIDEKFKLLRATCAIPLFFPVIEIEGGKYYDGGLADPIPIKKALSDGNTKNLIILTREKEYKKTVSKSANASARLIKKKYPNLEQIVLCRHDEYNKTVEYCERLEEQGKAIIIRPRAEVNVGRFEEDIPTLRKLYDAGFDDVVEKIDEIKQLSINND